MIDWHESPARVTSSSERTTFDNAAGESFTLTRTGVEVRTRGQTASCDWARLQSLAITFPEYPNSLKWFAFVVRGALAGAPRGGTVLEFAPAFLGFVWIIDVKFGLPARMWNLASRSSSLPLITLFRQRLISRTPICLMSTGNLSTFRFWSGCFVPSRLSENYCGRDVECC